MGFMDEIPTLSFNDPPVLDNKNGGKPADGMPVNKCQ